jgi:hypothetical protein
VSGNPTISLPYSNLPPNLHATAESDGVVQRLTLHCTGFAFQMWRAVPYFVLILLPGLLMLVRLMLRGHSLWAMLTLIEWMVLFPAAATALVLTPTALILGRLRTTIEVTPDALRITRNIGRLRCARSLQRAQIIGIARFGWKVQIKSRCLSRCAILSANSLRQSRWIAERLREMLQLPEQG